MILQEKRDTIAEYSPEAVVFDNPAFDQSIIGVTEDGRAVYEYDMMVAELAAFEEMTLEDAADFIQYNTIRSIPYAGEMAPIIIYKI